LFFAVFWASAIDDFRIVFDTLVILVVVVVVVVVTGDYQRQHQLQYVQV